MTQPSFDWDTYWQREGQPGDTTDSVRRAHREAADLALRWMPKQTTRIADVGSGSGIVSVLVGRELDASVVGVDASPEAVQIGVERATADGVSNVAFEVGTSDKLPFHDSSLDALFSDQMLQCVDEPAFMREAARVLRPGGRLIVMAPNRANVVFTATALTIGDRHGTRRTYTRGRLGRLARSAGLKVVGFDGYLPSYSIERLVYVYVPRLAPIAVAAERIADALDRWTGRAVSKRFGYAVALIAERPYQ